MTVLPRDRYQLGLLCGFLVFFVASCLRPPYPDYLLMQHVPTVPVVLLLSWFANRYAMSPTTFTLVVLFLALHTLGARYLYSYTPYDDWTDAVFGFRVNQAFGFERNHYDRMVHFSYGLLLAPAIQEFERRHLGLTPKLASILAIECILATSAGYELLEWLVAEVFTPDYADSFLGQQGDSFDAQKDMALATAGAMVAMACTALFRPVAAAESFDPGG